MMEPEFSLINNAWSSIEGASDKIPPSDASIQPYVDSASDNETSERPVRERLEKASIASVAQEGSVHSTAGIGADKEKQFGHINSSVQARHTPSRAQKYESSPNGYHARMERNHSYDELARSGKQENYANEIEEERNHTLTQKQSTNMQSNHTEDISGLKAIREAGNLASDESSLDFDAVANSSQKYITELSSGKLPLSQRDWDDPDEGFAMFGARKKRSRDQLDAEIDREQKIVATEEAKAQRRSHEQERDTLEAEMKTQRCVGSVSPQSEERGSKIFSISTTQEVLRSSDAPTALTFPDALTSQNPSLLVPFSSSFDDTVSSLQQSSTSATPPSNSARPLATSHSPSSSEGFHSKKVNTKEIDAPVNDARNRNQSEKISKSIKAADTSAPEHSLSLAFGAPQSSNMTVLGPSGFGSLGSGIFGTGFGHVFNAGTKLSSFAAPIGDANWGDQGGSTNLFGAPSKDEEEENSESEDYGLIDAENNDESYEVVCRLQQQDVNTGEDGEETVFSSARAGLFSWDGAAWKEGGKGVFKLNMTIPRTENLEQIQRSGRFIMRAHQTFRVLLNAPVFKQMKVGDSKGNEPTSKTLSFSVIEKGKPTPYLIRLNDVVESRTLYHAIRKLQQNL